MITLINSMHFLDGSKQTHPNMTIDVHFIKDVEDFLQKTIHLKFIFGEFFFYEN